MAVTLDRVGWTELFTQMRSPNMFLSRNFTVKPGGFYKGTKIAIDIERYGEDVAIAIRKCTGPNLNDFDNFTTKEFEPPSYGEAFPLDVCDLLMRMAGVDPYSAAGVEYGVQLAAQMATGFKLIDDKISRAVELQASQALQTGKITLTNSAGDTVYELDFLPKASHFPTVGTSWTDVANAPALADLESLAGTIRADGRINPNQLYFGSNAINNFIRNVDAKEALDNRRIDIGEIRPEFADSGATFYGFVWVGSYQFEMWVYPDTYTDPQTGLPVEYIDPNKVIMKSNNTRLDMTSAEVPLPLGPDPRVARFLPGRMSSRASAANSFDVTPNVYTTPNGKQIMGELESRPLLIPVQIDGYGCLDTVAP